MLHSDKDSGNIVSLFVPKHQSLYFSHRWMTRARRWSCHLFSSLSTKFHHGEATVDIIVECHLNPGVLSCKIAFQTAWIMEDFLLTRSKHRIYKCMNMGIIDSTEVDGPQQDIWPPWLFMSCASFIKCSLEFFSGWSRGIVNENMNLCCKMQWN